MLSTLMRILSWGYIVALHLVLAVLLLKTDAIEKIERRLGIWETPEMDHVWFNQLAFHRRIDAQLPPGVLVFLGDSLTQGFDISRFGRPAVNYGIGNDTTVSMLARLENYHTIATSSAVVLLIGVNDLKLRPPEEIAQNLAQLVRRIAGSTQLIAIGLLPVDEAKLGEGRNNVLRQINTELARACAGTRRCRYVDAWPVLAPGSNLLADYHDGDGLHLTSAGYDKLAAVIAPALPR